MLGEIRRVYSDPTIGRCHYGVRKVFHQLRREGGVDGLPVPRRQVERLMRADGLQGARRGRRFVTTRPDQAAPRPPDLVNRNFTAERPNALWIVDFTYVATWSGMAFTAFVSDVFSPPDRRLAHRQLDADVKSRTMALSCLLESSRIAIEGIVIGATLGVLMRRSGRARSDRYGEGHRRCGRIGPLPRTHPESLQK